MMTTQQKERAKKIIEEKKEMEAKGKLIDLLLEFWEQTNEIYEQGFHIVSIECGFKGWECYDEKNMDGYSKDNSPGEALRRILRKLDKYSVNDVYEQIKGKELESQLQECGFCISWSEREEEEEKNFEMEI